MSLVIDVAAWQDIHGIGTWIAKDSPRAARQIVRAILAAIEQLEVFPGLARQGRVAGTFQRRVSGTSYIIVLERWTDPAAIVVTAVVHGRRQS